MDEGGFPTSQDVSLERMLFNQLLALTVWLFLKTGGTQQPMAEESGQMDLDPDGSTDPGPSGSPHPSRNISRMSRKMWHGYIRVCGGGLLKLKF